MRGFYDERKNNNKKEIAILVGCLLLLFFGISCCGPFAFTMLTVDTHRTNGYVCRKCIGTV